MGFLLFALTACGQETPIEPEQHSLVLTASGTAKITSLTYTLDDRVISSGPTTLPWEETISIPADGHDHSWALEAKYSNGVVDLAATVDGQLLTQSSGGGTGEGTATIDGEIKSG